MIFEQNKQIADEMVKHSNSVIEDKPENEGNELTRRHDHTVILAGVKELLLIIFISLITVSSDTVKVKLFSDEGLKNIISAPSNRREHQLLLSVNREVSKGVGVGNNQELLFW